MEINRIKAANIKNLTLDSDKKVKKIPDGGGLYLFIYPTVKQWYFHYRYNGKVKDHYLGTFPRLTAENARKRRDKCWTIVNKIDIYYETEFFLFFSYSFSTLLGVL